MKNIDKKESQFLENTRIAALQSSLSSIKIAVLSRKRQAAMYGPLGDF